MVYTLTIPFLIIAVLLLSVHNSTNTRETELWSNLIGPHDLIRSAWDQQLSEFTLNTVEGRYAVVRRDLGLGELPIRLPYSFHSISSGVNTPSIRNRSPSHRPKIKRALDFILVDQAEPSPGSSRPDLPLLDDADNAPLEFTEDALWDYSNSKQTILDNFAQSAHRDEEDAAAATLANDVPTKMRAKAKTKKRKKVVDARKPRFVLKVRLK
jgi:hypothetical protein